MKPNLIPFVCFFIFVGITISCEEDNAKTDNSATMCYIKSGNILTVNCRPNSLDGSCESDGRTSLATYSDWETCYDDGKSVLNTYSTTGNISPGPNSKEGSSGTGNSNASCDESNYKGPSTTAYPQSATFCKMAWYYECYGYSKTSKEVSTYCNTYKNFENVPTCSYCQ